MTDCTFTEDDARWMRQALDLAHHSASLNEVPVGAVIVRDQQLLGQGWNAPISTCDSTHHAEIAAIRSAGESVQNYRLPGSTLYVTLEPCTMCFGAMIHARIERVVYATREPRAGVLISQLKLPDATFYNHQIAVEGGLLADQSAQLLTQFFRARRSANPEGSA
jgi:tRNA(adenine34) deaminase